MENNGYNTGIIKAKEEGIIKVQKQKIEIAVNCIIELVKSSQVKLSKFD
jgi:hypothetical protein